MHLVYKTEPEKCLGMVFDGQSRTDIKNDEVAMILKSVSVSALTMFHRGGSWATTESLLCRLTERQIPVLSTQERSILLCLAVDSGVLATILPERLSSAGLL